MPGRDNPFWQFSLAIYAEPGVGDECLALQDALDLDVNALLFCAWLGAAHKIILSDDDMAAIDARTATWRDIVVRPLRTIRQAMKPMPAMADDAVKELRSDIARIELRAEQIEQAMLFELTEMFLAGPRANSANATPADAVTYDAVTNNVTRFVQRHLPSTHAPEPPHPHNLVAAAIAYHPR